MVGGLVNVDINFSEWYSLDGWTTVDKRFDSEVIHSDVIPASSYILLLL